MVRRERKKERESPFYRMSASSVIPPIFPPSDRFARVLTEQRAFHSAVPSPSIATLPPPRIFSPAGVASTRRSPSPSLTLSPSSFDHQLLPSRFYVLHDFVLSLSLSLCLAPSVLPPSGGLSSRLKTVRCTGDPTRAYSPSLRLSLSARWSGWRAAAALPRGGGGRTLCPAASSTRCASSSFSLFPLFLCSPFSRTRAARPLSLRVLPLSCVVCFLVLRVNVEHQKKKRAKKQKEILTGSLTLAEQAKLLHLLVFLVNVSSPIFIGGWMVYRFTRGRPVCAKWLDVLLLPRSLSLSERVGALLWCFDHERRGDEIHPRSYASLE